MMPSVMDLRDPHNKRAVLAGLLEQGMVLVTLDARREGVDVPAPLHKDPQLRLNLSYRFGLPLHMDDQAVHATLTFSGTPYACSIPWAAIYLFVSHMSGKPILFAGDVPKELAHGLLETKVPGGENTLRPKLRLVTQPTKTRAKTTKEDPDPPSPPRKGHLRVVK